MASARGNWLLVIAERPGHPDIDSGTRYAQQKRSNSTPPKPPPSTQPMSPELAAQKTEWMITVLDRFQRPLLQYALSIVRDLEHARDIVQETMLKLHREDQAKIEGHLSPWLFKVCRNLALNHLKKARRSVELAPEEMEAVECEQRTPAQDMDHRERVAWAMQCVEELPGNMREVIRLKFQSQLSYKEISEITGLSVGNVGFLLSTGLGRLRARLEQDEKNEKIVALGKFV